MVCSIHPLQIFTKKKERMLDTLKKILTERRGFCPNSHLDSWEILSHVICMLTHLYPPY